MQCGLGQGQGVKRHCNPQMIVKRAERFHLAAVLCVRGQGPAIWQWQGCLLASLARRVLLKTSEMVSKDTVLLVINRWAVLVQRFKDDAIENNSNPKASRHSCTAIGGGDSTGKTLFCTILKKRGGNPSHISLPAPSRTQRQGPGPLTDRGSQRWLLMEMSNLHLCH